MRFKDFVKGLNYSRDEYAPRLMIRWSKERCHWAYYKDGDYARPITTDSLVHIEDDFYRSTVYGKRLVTVAMPKFSPSLWEGLRSNSPDTMVKGSQIVTMSTPSGGDSPFMKAYKESVEADDNRARFTREYTAKMDREIIEAMHHAIHTDTKEKKMSRFENTATQVKENIVQETIDVALINVGEIVFNMGGSVVERFAPKLTWYEKLFTSKEKRELAVMVGTYVAIQAVKTKYSHYIIDAVSAYLNFEMQKKLLGGLSQDTLDKLFSKFEKTEA